MLVKLQLFISIALSWMVTFHSCRNKFLQRIIKCCSSKVMQSVDKWKDMYILPTEYQKTSQVHLFQRIIKKKLTKLIWR